MNKAVVIITIICQVGALVYTHTLEFSGHTTSKTNATGCHNVCQTHRSTLS